MEHVLPLIHVNVPKDGGVLIAAFLYAPKYVIIMVIAPYQTSVHAKKVGLEMIAQLQYAHKTVTTESV